MSEPDESPLDPAIGVENRRQLAESLLTWQQFRSTIDSELVASVLRSQRMFAEMGRQAGESIRAVSSALRYQPVIPPVALRTDAAVAELGRGLTELSARLNEILAPTLVLAAELARRAMAAAVGQFDFAAISRSLARALPRNWRPLSALEWKKLPEVAVDHGIPITWVPRRELLVQVLAAADRAERVQLLIEHEGVILADCAACLEECTEPSLADEVTLARRALEAFQDGHAETAQSLAVEVANGLITAIIEEYRPGASTYPVARELAAQFDLEVSLANLRWLATLAPVNAFYRKWDGRRRDPVPAALNRHVHGHRPRLCHYRKDNALLAVMLMTSLLREQQAQLSPRVGSHEDPAA